MKTVVITGVSSGIGYVIAARLIQEGYRVFGSVRKEADGERLQIALGQYFTPLLFDVTDEKGIEEGVKKVTAVVGEKGLTALINNAGVAVAGPMMHISLDKMRYQLEVNLIGLLSVTQKFLPLLGAKKDAKHPAGRIINISSVSGSLVYPFLGPYAVSKHGVEVVSHALRRELALYGIEVVIVAPGSVDTPIWDKVDVERDIEPYVGTDYESILRRLLRSMIKRRSDGLPAHKIGDVVYQALVVKNPKVRYVPTPNRFVEWILPHWLPTKWLDRIIIKQLGLEKKE